MQTTKKSVFTNLIWRFAERCGAEVLQILVSIVLARILAPEAFGTIALLLVFSNILQVFVDSGLGNALIQKKDADDLDFSSVFYFNIFVCIVLYLALFFCAPVISRVYENPELTPLVRVLGLTVIISGIKNVQQAYISRTMQFKKFFITSLGGVIVAAVVSIVMALTLPQNVTIWALVAQKVINLAVATALMWVTVKWRPKLIFSWKRLKGLISYGWKLLVSSLIDTVYRELSKLIIGIKYNTADLAYYNQGNQYPNLIAINTNTAIDSVVFPVMSQEQNDPIRVKAMTRRAMKTGIYIMAPLMMGLAFTAPNVVSLILTDKWLPCVPFMRIFCITFMFYPLHTTNLNAIKAMGRSDLFLILEIAKKIVGVALIVATMWHSVMAMAYSLLVSSLASQIINSFPNKKLLNYSYFEQLKDILPSIILAVVMGVCVHFIGYSNLPIIIELIIQVLAGAGVYIIGSVITKNDSFGYMLDILKSFLSKKKKVKQ